MIACRLGSKHRETRKRFMESDTVRESVTNEDAEAANSTREEWQIKSWQRRNTVSTVVWGSAPVNPSARGVQNC
jgi:hypothetical protein